MIPDEWQSTMFILEQLLWIFFLILYLERKLNIDSETGMNFALANF